MDRNTGIRVGGHAVDWLEVAADLPHLFARLSELVHAQGYAPEDLVVIPRSEIDRRETAAFTAGWAEAMAEELPRIRREYERRIAEAYAAGGGRGADTAARSTPGEGQGATVIRLPFATLLEPSPLVVETEERMRRAQEILGRRSEAEPEAQRDAEPEAEPEAEVEADHAQAAEPDVEPAQPHRHEEAAPPGAPGAPAPRARGKRATLVGRKVVRRNGRPIVPPLNSVPAQSRTQGSPADAPADGPGTAGEPRRPSLVAKARALAQELESRAGGGRPEAPEVPEGGG